MFTPAPDEPYNEQHKVINDTRLDVVLTKVYLGIDGLIDGSFIKLLFSDLTKIYDQYISYEGLPGVLGNKGTRTPPGRPSVTFLS